MSGVRVVRFAAMAVGTSMAALIGLLLLWLVVAYGANWHDEPLTAAARSMLAVPRNPFPDDQNLYVAFAGFDAPHGQSMIAAGELRIEAYNHSDDRMPSAPAQALAFKGNATAWQWLTTSMWSFANMRAAELETLATANRELYQRYVSLHDFPDYFDSSRPGPPGLLMPFPPWRIQALYLGEIARSLQVGTPSQQHAALVSLNQDLRMWQTVLGGDGDMLSKVLAASALHADSLLLGDMIADENSDLTVLSTDLQPVLTPFPMSTWKVGNAYGRRMRTAAAFLGMADSSERSWGSHFLKINATENLEAEVTERLVALANGDPETFVRRRGEYRKWFRHNFPQGSLPLYNPIGRTLIAVDLPDGEAWSLARIYDVAAFQRLVFLAYELREHGVARGNVATFLKQHPQWAIDPITGEPFLWNADAGVLAVAPIARDTGRERLRLPLFTQPALGHRLARGQGQDLRHVGGEGAGGQDAERLGTGPP